jgi:hypothetical protein
MNLLDRDFSKDKIFQRSWVAIPTHDNILFNERLDEFLREKGQALDIITYTLSHRHHPRLRQLVNRCVVGLAEASDPITPSAWPNATFRYTDGVHIKLYLLRNPRKSTRTHTHAIIGSHNFVLNTSYNLSYVITDRNHIAVLSSFFTTLWNSLA